MRAPQAGHNEAEPRGTASLTSQSVNSVYMERYRSGHNEAVLKTVWVQAHVGSNPTLSAKL